MITKKTTYALYGEVTQKDGSKAQFHIEGSVCPRVKTYKDLLYFEADALKKSGLTYKINVWYPISVEYLWFVGLKKWFNNIFKKKTV